jgi:hypothetical protein
MERNKNSIIDAFSNLITCLFTSSPPNIPPPAGVLRNSNRHYLGV